jgi:3-dehydroquinate dehydratase
MGGHRMAIPEISGPNLDLTGMGQQAIHGDRMVLMEMKRTVVHGCKMDFKVKAIQETLGHKVDIKGILITVIRGQGMAI